MSFNPISTNHEKKIFNFSNTPPEDCEQDTNEDSDFFSQKIFLKAVELKNSFVSTLETHGNFKAGYTLLLDDVFLENILGKNNLEQLFTQIYKLNSPFDFHLMISFFKQALNKRIDAMTPKERDYLDLRIYQLSGEFRENPVWGKENRLEDLGRCMLAMRDTLMLRASSVPVNTKMHEELYKALQIFYECAESFGIKWAANGGTLLGAVREKGIIRFDDDIDIAIHKECLSVLQSPSFRKMAQKKGFELIENSVCWKFQKIDGNPTKEDQGQFKFPWIDIFPVGTTKDDPSFLHHSQPKARSEWPNDGYTQEEWDNLVEIPFGPLSVPGLPKAEAMRYLNTNYGSTWDKQMYPQFDHVTYTALEKTPYFADIPTPIPVNWNYINLQDFFSNAYLINLDHKKDQITKLTEHLASIRQGDFKYTRISAVDAENISPSEYKKMSNSSYAQSCGKDDCKGRYACFQSHLKAIKQAKMQNLHNVLILEDNVRFMPRHLTGSYLKEVFEELPRDWDLLFLGYYDYAPREKQAFSDHLVKPGCPYDMHAYLLNSPMYDKVIEILEAELKKGEGQMRAVDVVFSEELPKKYQVFACKDNVAFQDEGFSSSTNQYIKGNYSKELRELDAFLA